MQPLALAAIGIGAVMLAGVSAVLWLTRRDSRPRAAVNRWQRHGSLPLAAAGLGLGIVGGVGAGSTATHNVIVGVAATLLAAALACAVIGSTSARSRPR